MKLEEMINQNHQKLNENDYIVLRYIIQNKKKCESLSIQELSKICSISPASIVRLMQKLGFAGYSEFKYHLKSHQAEITSDSDLSGLLQKDINATLKLIRDTDLSDILSVIHRAKRIFVFGSGYSQQLMLQEFNHCMATCQKDLFLIPARHELCTRIYSMKPDDLVIIASYSGRITDYESSVHALNLLKIPILSITGFGTNELAEHADYSLYYQSTPLTPGQEPRRISYLALNLVLESLYRAYFQFWENNKK